MTEIENKPYQQFLSGKSPFADEDYAPGKTALKSLQSCRVLVVGAGGLGCEILKNLALCGFKDIHVIDMDTIDVSNLNRQFLFRPKDIGQSKAITAAQFIMNRVDGTTITPHHCAIQDKKDVFYMQFDLVVCGLDSVEARRWINATLVGLVDESDIRSLKPLIDGGTEGFKGQARVILPTLSSCYECSLDMLSPATHFPICTIQNTPRLPEHCIEWASVLEWPKAFGDQNKKLNNDDPEHIRWVYEKALDRAQQFGISGVTYSLTQGVVKSIIPAVASTNAVIAAACSNEAFKIATSCAPYLDNYMMYTGTEGIYTYTFQHAKKDDCPVCGSASRRVSLNRTWTLWDFMEFLANDTASQAKKPSLRTAKRLLYMQAPPQLEEATRGNLDTMLTELVDEGDEIIVTNATLPLSLRLISTWQD